jgi:simple sugar transport system ATP-binding protein
LQELAKAGSAVLVISQDLDELMAITDRIAALCAGRLSALHDTESITIQQVGMLMGGESLAEVPT